MKFHLVHIKYMHKIRRHFRLRNHIQRKKVQKWQFKKIIKPRYLLTQNSNLLASYLAIKSLKTPESVTAQLTESSTNV